MAAAAAGRRLADPAQDDTRGTYLYVDVRSKVAGFGSAWVYMAVFRGSSMQTYLIDPTPYTSGAGDAFVRVGDALLFRGDRLRQRDPVEYGGPAVLVEVLSTTFPSNFNYDAERKLAPPAGYDAPGSSRVRVSFMDSDGNSMFGRGCVVDGACAASGRDPFNSALIYGDAFAGGGSSLSTAGMSPVLTRSGVLWVFKGKAVSVAQVRIEERPCTDSASLALCFYPSSPFPYPSSL